MLKVVQLIKTCFACPSQWNGRFDDGDSLYIRYRFGNLTIYKGFNQNETRRKLICSFGIGDNFDGIMNFNELKEYLKEIIIFDCIEEFEK